MTIRTMLLVAICLALFAGIPAQAQCNPGTFWVNSETGFQDQYIPFLTYGPDYGFSIYGCPTPFLWASGVLNRNYSWFSTCLSGGQFVSVIDTTGDPAFPSQLNQASELRNPFDNSLQGIDNGFAYVPSANFGLATPQWVQLEKHGGPCGPNF